jgi:dihydroorotate dehydrogenase electron transfer subunit
VEILENDPIARQTFRLRFRCLEIAQQFVPGQFLMLRLSDYDDPLIGRPLAIYDCASEIGEAAPSLVDVVYLAAGKMTRRLAQLQSGQEVTVWGPLGNGFPAQRTNHLIMVAGGIGQTPFLALAKEHLHVRAFGRPARDVPVVPRITLCYGARSAEFLAGLSDFERHGVEVRVSTDDGSRGHRGLVTDILDQLLDETEGDSRQIVCCGPEPMMAAVSRLAIRRRVPAQASLETPMACGIGICFSCVAEIVDDEGQADYRRTCVEGPVFAADRIRWGH